MIHFIKKSILVVWLVFSLALPGIAQPSPPGHGEEENQPAPIGSGVVILLALAGAYGAKKVYNANRSHTPKEPSS